MSVHDLIGELQRRNIRLSLENGSLRFSAPRGAMDPDLQQRLSAAKAELIELLSRRSGDTGTGADAPEAEESALSFSQQRLLFLHRMDPASTAYTMLVGRRLRGALDRDALAAALQALPRRHEALRTSFHEDGAEHVARVADEVQVPLVTLSLREHAAADRPAALEALTDREARQLFDLTVPPLLRATLVELDTDDHVLLIAMHHLVSDGWSLDVLGRDLWSAYADAVAGGAPALPPASRYRAFIGRQRQWMGSPAHEAQKRYWKEALTGAPDLLELPTDRPRPPVQVHDGAVTRFDLPADLVGRLDRLARLTGSSLYMVLLSGLFVLLHRYTGQDDISIGTPVANRPDRRWEESVGFFSNVVVIRQAVRPAQTWQELATTVRDAALSALEHQEFPFEQVVEHLQPRRSLSHSPLFQVMFSLKEGTAAEQAPGLTITAHPVASHVSKFDLTLTVERTAEGAVAGFEYATALFDAATIQRMAEHYNGLLRRFADAPDGRIGGIDIIDPAVYRTLASAWNPPATPIPGDRLVHELIAARAEDEPDAVAVSFAGTDVTRAELVARARRLARRLRNAGIGPDDRVGVHVDRSPELVVALLGVLMAGAAYVPLDPNYPEARLADIGADAGLGALVTTAGQKARPPAIEGPIIDLASLETENAAALEPTTGPTPQEPTGENLAYVIYTSGSTGKPKGVMVSHRNVLNLFSGLDTALEPSLPRSAGSGRPVWMALTSISFDISVLELLWTLARGHHVVLQQDHLTALSVASAAANGSGGTAAVRSARRIGRQRPAPSFSLFYFASDEDSLADKYELLIEGAKFADANGLSAVWVPERHFHAFGGQFPNPSVAAAAVAAVTSRIQVRAGSVVLPLHDPIRVAEEWSMVDNLSRGRAAVAFASGWQFNDFVLAPDRFQDRHNVLRKGIDEVRRLWAGGTVQRTDGLGNQVDIAIRPRPVQAELPVWITAAANPDTFRYAGEIGANVLTHLLGQSLEELRERIGIYRQARRDNGHDPDAGQVTLMLHSFVGDDLEKVRETVRGPFKSYLRSAINLLRPVAESQGLDAGNDMELVVEAGFNRYFATSALFGTPETCRKLVQDVADLGVDEIACLIDFGVPPADVLASLPHLRQLRDAVTAAETIEPLIDIRSDATHIQCTPSFAKLLLEQEGAGSLLAGVSGFLVGGEALSPALARQLTGQVGGDVFNMYGPTETTVWSAVHHIAEDETVIGRPISNTQLHVLDEAGLPVPIGVKGELHIGGEGVTRGYRGRPDLTAERFIPDPFSSHPGARLYRTGDLVRRRPDGMIDFLGRMDGQVKVRGFRVELGEVEAALLSAPDVDAAAAVVRTEQAHEAAIFAYVVPRQGSTVSPAALLDHLRARVPDYMLPSAVMVLEALPLTPNGKVDRKALPTPSARTQVQAPKDLPRNAIEARLSEIWREILKVDAVGVNDNFFELGGHSLLLGRLQQKLNEVFGRSIGIIELFKYPTISSLTRLIDEPTARTDRIRKAAERTRSAQENQQRQREQRKLRNRHG